MLNMKFTFSEVNKILEKCDSEILFPDETILQFFNLYALTKDTDEHKRITLESVCAIVMRLNFKQF